MTHKSLNFMVHVRIAVGSAGVYLSRFSTTVTRGLHYKLIQKHDVLLNIISTTRLHVMVKYFVILTSFSECFEGCNWSSLRLLTSVFVIYRQYLSICDQPHLNWNCVPYLLKLILILIYLSTAIGLTPGGSRHLHIYNTQNIKLTTKQHE
jgi:hypothetical protein